MNSKERIAAAIEGKPADHVPLTTWCFGFPAPKHLAWETNGRPVRFWYTNRLEHIHKLPYAWTLEDDFKRVEAWQSLGVDDVLEVSVPWGIDPRVSWQDSTVSASESGEGYPVMVRQYKTPSGPLRHAVRKTGEEQGEGWVVQPDCVPLIEDHNIPRAVEHAVSFPSDIGPLSHLYYPPQSEQKDWFAQRMKEVKQFADRKGIFVQAWSAFGMDAVVWFTGTEGAIMMAMDRPEEFGKLIDLIYRTDYARTELATTTPGVDMVCLRGWYSSTDFWSPKLFDRFLFDPIKSLADLAHKNGKKFGYVMTTGVEILGPRLADAGVDVLYFVDPVQDRIDLDKAKKLLGDRMTMVGGTNALSLGSGNPQRIRNEVHRAIDTLGPTNRFVLHPVDAIFPDTPWEGVERMIDAWKEYR